MTTKRKTFSDDFLGETRVEDEISRFISQFNVSIRNKDDKRKFEGAKEKLCMFHFLMVF